MAISATMHCGWWISYFLPLWMVTWGVGCCACFQPTPSPRFDVFLDHILGPWHHHPCSSSTGTTSTSSVTRREVKEVMRSCGGAVQGIREVSFGMGSALNNDTDTHADVSGLYLNRADDGFIFHDDGSYSVGPTKWTLASNKNDMGSTWMASLALNPSCRILIDAFPLLLAPILNDDDNNNNLPDLKDSIKCLVLVRGERQEKHCLEIAVIDRQSFQKLPIHWAEQIRCRMSSSSQPWMRQRFKWEKCVLPKVSDSVSRSDETIQSIVNVGAWREDLFDGTIRLSARAALSNSPTAVGYCWEYHSSGSLSSVTWMRG